MLGLSTLHGLTVIAAWVVLLVCRSSSPVGAQELSVAKFQLKDFPTPRHGTPYSIVAGPDGNIWFTLTGEIGRVTPSGVVTELPLPTLGETRGITVGADRNIWFTVYDANMIGRITPGGSVTLFTLPNMYSLPQGITSGPDGQLWFTQVRYARIGRLSPKAS